MSVAWLPELTETHLSDQEEQVFRRQPSLPAEGHGCSATCKHCPPRDRPPDLGLLTLQGLALNKRQPPLPRCSWPHVPVATTLQHRAPTTVTEAVWTGHLHRLQMTETSTWRPPEGRQRPVSDAQGRIHVCTAVLGAGSAWGRGRQGRTAGSPHRLRFTPLSSSRVSL